MVVILKVKNNVKTESVLCNKINCYIYYYITLSLKGKNKIGANVFVTIKFVLKYFFSY